MKLLISLIWKIFFIGLVASCSMASAYKFTDLPSVTSIMVDCSMDNNSHIKAPYLVKFDLGKLSQDEIKSMKAIFYELPSGKSYEVVIDPAHHREFLASEFTPNRRHIAFLIVKIPSANTSSSSNSPLTDWLWSQKYEFSSCSAENQSSGCLCDPVNSWNSSAAQCRPDSTQCRCLSHVAGADCSMCLDGFYRDYSRYQLGCLPCQCSSENFAGPCAWRHVGDPVVDRSEIGVNRRACLGCKPGFEGEACLPPVDPHGVGLAAKVFIVLACLLCSLALLAAFVILRRQCRRRAQRAARHSLAVQRLFSRFKDDTSLEAEAAESSAILAEDDDLQRATQQLRLGADPVYQPTTVSIT